MRGKIITALVALACVGGYFSFPHLVRWQVQKRLPGVTFRDVNVTLDHVTLRGVSFNKGWVRGTVDRVVTDWGQTRVEVVGGDLDVDLDARREGTGEARKRTVEASGLTVRVKRGDHRATLTGARLEGSRVCFDQATVEQPLPVTVERGCVERDGTTGTAGKVTTGTGHTVRGVEIGPVTATEVEVDLPGRGAKAASVTTTVTIEGQALPVEGTGVELQRGEQDVAKLARVTTSHPWLASTPVTFEGVTVTRGKEVTVRVGESTVRIEPETLTFQGEEPCQTWAASLPGALRVHPLDTVKLTGTAGFKVTLRPKASMSLKSSCRADCRTMPDLRRTFNYRAYTSKGNGFERTTGRGTLGWLPVSLMGHLPVAVPALEDPGFASHRGFITQAFENSLIDNLKQGRFLRGGSTLTMQLAKNLWLTREKTLGRKVQEFLLAQAVESCYQKDEILELYLNVVEFGPDQYGAAAGAQHWFGKGPGELTPTEAFWMASILPRPSRTAPPDEATLKRTEGLMKRLAASGHIPEFVTEPSETDLAGWEAEQ